jgi:hypothetical protein
MIRASIVFPVPGGPVNRTPLIGSAPIFASLSPRSSGSSISSRAGDAGRVGACDGVTDLVVDAAVGRDAMPAASAVDDGHAVVSELHDTDPQPVGAGLSVCVHWPDLWGRELEVVVTLTHEDDGADRHLERFASAVDRGGRSLG